ncbi:MAG TPA: tRNA epoxyqueuosine(34) reductase QueG [Candidatus Limnocylindria bacterium]|nr:tRNA epoxyqueuosine(34) reductase QueG [Candidatus Limnocylindria bacterium]
MTTLASTRARIAALAARHGLELLGVAPAEPLPGVEDRLREAVSAGRMARMDWMGGDRPLLAADPRRHDPAARSVIVVAAPYAGRDRAAWDDAPDRLHAALAEVLGAEPAQPAGLVARYAIGTDYHRALRARLERLAADLRRSGVGAGEVAYVDDRPLAERAFAARAGIGWIGKNSNLLTHQRAGSWVFIGAILSGAALPTDEPLRSSCGACRRCIDGCPTGAIVAPRVVDARRCISYLTIEHPGELDEWSARAIGRWIFGCDVCQEVCPVNAEADDAGPLHVPLIAFGEWLLVRGTRRVARELGETALTRAGRHRLLRNVACALGNALRSGGLAAATVDRSAAFLRTASGDRRPEVAAAARWALRAVPPGRGPFGGE